MPFNIIASTKDATVVTEYIPEKSRSDAYQSEAALEEAFIKLLISQGYTRLHIKNSKDMIDNLRLQLEKLNNYKFSDAEWDRFFSQNVANKNDGIVEKTKKIQEDNIQVLKRDDGSSQNIMLINKVNIHANSLQVINQYVEENGNHETRYDVTILVNGLPLVHIELKRRGVALKEAFNQIERYQRDSFWADSGLYEYVQVFVISNGTRTKYYSNTTRISAIKERTNGKKKIQKTSHSFEFTSYWSDSKNKVIFDLVDFTKTFFAKHTLLNILTKYCVLTSDDLLLVMRPYQIFATEQILNKIEISSNYPNMLGTRDAGGFIWHTTGSGKTLTSFKTAQLASKRQDVDKVLFVVDRKDLDYQTMKEYDRFEKGAADGNKNTATLQRQLENKDAHGNYKEYKIIITTIQKLDRFIAKNQTHGVYDKRVVMIFDECHRSQFGEMHTKIAKKFKKYNIFGFTGTPIFAKNSKSSIRKLSSNEADDVSLRTTEQVFGNKLHTYTIVNAIRDGNVLPFKIDYVNTIKQDEDAKDEKVEAIDAQSVLLAPERIAGVVSYILEHFNQKTKRSNYYGFNRTTNVADVVSGKAKESAKIQINGFNSILAVSSIEAAKLYYLEFKKQMSEGSDKKLRIATIFSYSANEAEPDGFIDDEDSDSTDGLDLTSREFLEEAISDYNTMFNTSYDTSTSKFPNYYKDLSLRMKNREVDLLIVVNMFLTGFDATTLNTLWVDKNLEHHGLIQAFSRTNRILNSVKTFGNIVCFRNLQGQTEDAISLFGDTAASGIVLMKSYDDYYYGYDDEEQKHHDGYKDIVEKLVDEFPVCDLNNSISSEKSRKQFIKLFGKILRLRNILTAFDDFAGNGILSDIDLQDYTGTYNDIYAEIKDNPHAQNINDDIVFEMELVKQTEINIDYILDLVEKYHASNCTDKTILVDVNRAVKSNPELHSKKELIDLFVSLVNVGENTRNHWRDFVEEQKRIELEAMIRSYNLNRTETAKFIYSALNSGELKLSGDGINKLLPKISRFGGQADSDYSKTKRIVCKKLQEFFDKYYDVC
jgi:type I restriction enzyme R subunit